jgi:hypothetical protein
VRSGGVESLDEATATQERSPLSSREETQSDDYAESPVRGHRRKVAILAIVLVVLLAVIGATFGLTRHSSTAGQRAVASWLKHGGHSELSSIERDLSHINKDVSQEDTPDFLTECSDLYADAIEAQTDPRIPIPSIENNWAAMLGEYVKGANECDDSQDGGQLPDPGQPVLSSGFAVMVHGDKKLAEVTSQLNHPPSRIGEKSRSTVVKHTTLLTPTVTKPSKGTSTPSATTPPVPEVAKCPHAGPPAVRPAHLLMGCANALNPRVKVVSWTTWTSTGATGKGIVNLNTCIPDCATGKNITYSATITLSDPLFTKGTLEIFQDLTISPTGAQGQVETASQPGGVGGGWGYFTGNPDTPLPPGQT